MLIFKILVKRGFRVSGSLLPPPLPCTNFSDIMRPSHHLN
nr:MAG TPA: hypothetical protein [Myoviridae sp. ctGMm2]